MASANTGNFGKEYDNMRKLNILLIGLLGAFLAFATPVLAIPALKASNWSKKLHYF